MGFHRASLLFLLGALLSTTAFPARSDGSKCQNVSCSPPIAGAQCTAKYERDDRCCPVWYCSQNGVTSTIYGKVSGSSSGSSSSWSSSSSSGNMGGFPLIQLPNLANLFG